VFFFVCDVAPLTLNLNCFQVQELGLQEAYKNDRGTNEFLRKLTALPYLPADKIPRRFQRLKREASIRAVKKMVKYVDENWISSEFFPPTSWSVFKQAVRANNDLEGWHNTLNRRAKGKAQLPLYTLINLLHEEALLVNLQIRLVSDKLLKRHQRTTYKKMQKRLFALWKEYDDDEKNARELLEACAHLVKPINREN